MGGPSSQDYAPIPAEPVEERIDDGVEATRDDAEVSDDEGLYNTGAPLLSRRSRGNETPCPHRRTFAQRLASMLRRPTWTNTKGSKRSWASISIMGFIGLLLTTVVALSISTGVLAQRPSHCNSYYRPYRQRTHIPLNQEYRSSNQRLNFPYVYPPLTSGPTSPCRTAWNTLQYVPCHEKIWNRSWDNGKHETLFELDPTLYSGPMCSTGCAQAISRAYRLILSQCTDEDKFDMSGYVGSFTADPGLEEGPIGVIATIERRLQHTCRQNPLTYYQEYCVASMYSDWFVIDGMNTGNLEGLDLIETATRESRTQPPRYGGSNNNDECDNTWTTYSRPEQRRFGPGVNQTSCSWCTIDWFDRKLQSWEDGGVMDPKNGSAVALPEYLHRIRHVGQRCQADDWDRIYGKAIRTYKNDGLLPPDWKDEGHDGSEKKPCKTKSGETAQSTPGRKVLEPKPVKPAKPVKPMKPVKPLRPLPPPDAPESLGPTESLELS